jgi:hypothetical protein
MTRSELAAWCVTVTDPKYYENEESSVPEIQPGAKVRVQLPNWDGPGVMVYTFEGIEGDVAFLRKPIIPGSNGGVVTFPADQIIPA